jgi:hypothetical protein
MQIPLPVADYRPDIRVLDPKVNAGCATACVAGT